MFKNKIQAINYKSRKDQKLWKWKMPLSLSILNKTYALQFLMGASSENTNNKWLSAIYFSKNNADIFNWHFIRVRCFSVYSSFRWLNHYKFDVFPNKTPKIMFASRTPVFANLMLWAGLITDTASSSNRWLNGNLSAQIRLKLVPNYLFLPDPEENKMITKEAFYKNIPVITITNSDSIFHAGVALYGNNRAFKYTSQFTEMVIRLIQLKFLSTQRTNLYKSVYKNSNWFMSSQR
jgi:hypothetical protein